MYHNLNNQLLANVYIGLVVSNFYLQFSFLNCAFFPFCCSPSTSAIWCLLVTQHHFIPPSFSLFSEMFFWLLSLVLSFWILSFHSPFFVPIKDKDSLPQNCSSLVPACSPHTLSNPRGSEKEALSIRFLVRNKRLVLAGSRGRISVILSTPFPREQQWSMPAHPTLFKLSFALSVKSWHPGDSRTCSEFNPREPPINITWLFLPGSCSLSMPDVEWCLGYSLSGPLPSWPS